MLLVEGNDILNWESPERFRKLQTEVAPTMSSISSFPHLELVRKFGLIKEFAAIAEFYLDVSASLIFNELGGKGINTRHGKQDNLPMTLEHTIEFLGACHETLDILKYIAADTSFLGKFAFFSMAERNFFIHGVVMPANLNTPWKIAKIKKGKQKHNFETMQWADVTLDGTCNRLAKIATDATDYFDALKALCMKKGSSQFCGPEADNSDR